MCPEKWKTLSWHALADLTLSSMQCPWRWRNICNICNLMHILCNILAQMASFFFFGPRFWWPNVWSSEDLRSRAWRRFFVHFVPNTFVNETKFVNIQTLQTLQMSLQTFHLNSSLTIGNFWRLISYRFCAEIFLFPWQLSNWCWDPSNQRNSSSFYSFYPKLSWTSSYLERLELHRYPSLVTRDSQEQLEVESQEL